MHRRRTLNASKIEASAGFLLLSPSYGESGRREEPCNTSAAPGTLAASCPSTSSSILSSKTSSPGCATRRRRPRSSAGSPTGWRCSSWLKNDREYIPPGLGDFGDRHYGTSPDLSP